MLFRDGRLATKCSSTKKNKRSDDSVIEQVSSHKMLAVVIDSQMNYESHIGELCKKLSKRIGLLKQISPFLKHLYGNMIWGSCNVEHLQSILKVQKRAAQLYSMLKDLHHQSYYSII